MEVLAIRFGSFACYAALGAVGVSGLSPWTAAARLALTTMLAFTAAAHFSSTRGDLIAMVPPRWPRPDLLVTLTGAAEAALAALLLVPPARPFASFALIAMFVAMFPANVSAARRGVGIRGRPPTPLWLRAPMQLLFIAWAWIVR